MEEASALADKVGILAKRMLGTFRDACEKIPDLTFASAVGTTETLSARYGTYEVHFSCRSREDVTNAQILMTRFPGSRMADDVATRFEVPLQDGTTLSKLFKDLASESNSAEFTVEKATLESVFLKVIRQNNILEDEAGEPQRSRWRWWKK